MYYRPGSPFNFGPYDSIKKNFTCGNKILTVVKHSRSHEEMWSDDLVTDPPDFTHKCWLHGSGGCMMMI
jgi:hypothetical protein